MSNWKDYPHLFANGKFKVKIEWEDGMIETVPLYVNSKGQAIADFKKNSGGEIRKFPYKFVALISRKIEDMTDEEFLECAKLINEPVNRETAESFQKFIKEEGWLPSNILLYLLSIGVYPFDQSHFETGEVIDTKTL